MCFLRSIVNLCFEELKLTNLKISSLSLIVLSQFSVKIFAQNSNSACEFCNDLHKIACFGVFGSKWACLIMKALKNLKFDSYWLTLLYSTVAVDYLTRYQVLNKGRIYCTRTANNMQESNRWLVCFSPCSSCSKSLPATPDRPLSPPHSQHRWTALMCNCIRYRRSTC